MEKLLKLLAIILTLIIVISFYPAIAWDWLARPIFWLLYILGIVADLWCINLLKKMQSSQN